MGTTRWAELDAPVRDGGAGALGPRAATRRQALLLGPSPVGRDRGDAFFVDDVNPVVILVNFQMH